MEKPLMEKINDVIKSHFSPQYVEYDEQRILWTTEHTPPGKIMECVIRSKAKPKKNEITMTEFNEREIDLRGTAYFCTGSASVTHHEMEEGDWETPAFVDSDWVIDDGLEVFTMNDDDEKIYIRQTSSLYYDIINKLYDELEEDEKFQDKLYEQFN